MEDTEGDKWFGKWQNRVLQAMQSLLQPFEVRDVLVWVYILMITDGGSRNCENERDCMPKLMQSLREERSTSALKFKVDSKPLRIEDLTEKVRDLTGKHRCFCRKEESDKDSSW